MMKQKYADGSRVLLAAFEDEPEEEAMVLEYCGNDLYCVEVLKPQHEYDDGLREVLVEQILHLV